MSIVVSKDSSERLEREREFHDHAFCSDLRECTQKFYALTQIEWDEYEARLRALVPGADILEFGCGPYGFIEPLRNVLHSVDQSLFQVFPFLRRHAWMALLEAKVN